MIIYYKKNTGEIFGVTNGRIHKADHLKMWLGDKETSDRIVVQWIPVRWYDKDGKPVEKGAKNPKTGASLAFAADFEPDHAQKDLMTLFDTNPSKVYDYKVDIETLQFVPKQP